MTDAAQNGEGYKVTPIPAADFAVNPADAGWVDAMCVKQPLATFEQKLAVSWPTGAEARVHACRRLGAVAVPAVRCAAGG